MVVASAFLNGCCAEGVVSLEGCGCFSGSDVVGSAGFSCFVMFADFHVLLVCLEMDFDSGGQASVC